MIAKKNGHARVKRGYKNKSLFAWVGDQRNYYKKGNLKREYKDLLNDLGFIWDAHQQQWEGSLETLVQFKKKYGHMNPDYKTQINLVGWINNQRILKRKGKLSQLRIDMLDEVGFEWEGIKARK